MYAYIHFCMHIVKQVYVHVCIHNRQTCMLCMNFADDWNTFYRLYVTWRHIYVLVYTYVTWDHIYMYVCTYTRLNPQIHSMHTHNAYTQCIHTMHTHNAYILHMTGIHADYMWHEGISMCVCVHIHVWNRTYTPCIHVYTP